MPVPTDYTGLTFNLLTAVSFTGKYTSTVSGNKKRIWLFNCRCGKETEKVMEKVVKGHVKSCGCLKGQFVGLESLQYEVYNSNGYSDADITFEQFLTLSQQPCFYCGDWKPNIRTAKRQNNPATFFYHGLNRKDHSLPHTLKNCVPCCWDHNNLISDTNHDDFIQDIEKIYLNLIKNNIISSQSE